MGDAANGLTARVCLLDDPSLWGEYFAVAGVWLPAPNRASLESRFHSLILGAFMKVYLLVTFHASVQEDVAALELLRRQLKLIGADIEPVTVSTTKVALAFTLPETIGLHAVTEAIHPNRSAAPCPYFVTELTHQWRTTLSASRWIGQQLSLSPTLRPGSST